MKYLLILGLVILVARPCVGENLIPHGDWRTGSDPSPWVVAQGDGKVLGFDKGKDGNRCLKIDLPPGRSIRLEIPTITVDPKKKYRFQYQYKTTAKRIVWSTIAVEYFNPGRSLGAQSMAFLDNQAEWKTKEYLLIIPEGTTTCKVRLKITETGDYWIDGVSISEISGKEASRLSLVGKMKAIPVRKARRLPEIAPEGKYSVRQVKDVWWLFDPEGKAFWNVSLWGGGPIGEDGELPLRKTIQSRYYMTGKTNEYYNTVFDNLTEWGFNSMGAGVEIGPMNRALQMRQLNKAATLPYVDTLVLSINLPGRDGHRLWEIAEGLYGVGRVKVEDLAMVDRNSKPVLGTAVPFPDVFSEKFRTAYDLYVKEWFEKRRAGDCFAVCLDNELPWAELPQAIYSPACRREFADFAKAKFKGRIDEYNKRYNTGLKTFEELDNTMPHRSGGVGDELIFEFLRRYIREYFAFQIATVRKYRPDCLIIGQRLPFAAAMDGFGRTKAIYDWCIDLFSVYDMIGLNVYPQGQDHFTRDQMRTVEYFHKKTGRPLVITEWCICCEQSGVPTTVGWPLWSTVPTWEDRGNGYRNCLIQLASLPYVVGAHWFSSYNGYTWIEGVRQPAYNHGFYQDDYTPNPVFLKKVVEANKMVTHMERKAGFSVDDIKYLRE
ncbi:MAG: beta-galactosidase [bacterium]